MATEVQSLTNIMPKILARGLMTLRQRCIMPRLVNSDYGVEAAKKGQSIAVPTSVAVPTIDVAITASTLGPTARVPGVVNIPLDQWKQSTPIGLSDKDLVEIDANEHFLPMQLEEAVKGIASTVNQFIMSKYKGVNRGIYGFLTSAPSRVDATVDPFTSGTTPTSGVSAATGAKKVLNQQLCPRAGRVGVLNFDAEAHALDLSAFSDADKIMSAVVKMEGEIGRKFGINWTADDDVPDHTAGYVDVTRAACTVKVTEPVGNPHVGLISTEGATQIYNRGDVIHFQGYEGDYTVIGTAGADPVATLNADTSTAVDVSIWPVLREEIASTTVVETYNSHAVNLVFHPNAFAFATRPLLANSSQYSLGNLMLSMQDPVTGLILRLEVSRQHKQTVWEFDILYGADLVRAELAMRLAGAV